MLQTVLLHTLEISLLTGAVIAVLTIFARRLNKALDARWKYWIWLLLAVRLLIPVGMTLPHAPIPVMLPPPAQVAATMAAQVIEPIAAAESGATQATAQSAAIPITTLIAAVWLAGAVFFLVKQLIGYRLECKRLLRWCTPMRDETILAQVRMERYILGIRRHVDVLACSRACSPMMIGFFRAKLLLPQEITGRTHGEAAFVLRHELIHLKRNDLWYKLLLSLANAVHWFNPLAYLMFREASTDLELSCDARVVQGGDMETRRAYSETILSFMPRKTRGARLSTNFNGGTEAMKERFTNIFSPGKRKRGIALFVALLMAVGMGGSLLGISVAESTDGIAAMIEKWKVEYADTGWQVVTSFGMEPSEEDIAQEEALRIAVETIMKMKGVGIGFFDDCAPRFSFTVYEDGRHEWYVWFNHADVQNDEFAYSVIMDAGTGKVTYYQMGGRG